MSLQHEGGMKRNSHLGRCEAGVCQVSLLHGAHEGVIDSSTGQSSAGKLGLIVFLKKRLWTEEMKSCCSLNDPVSAGLFCG